VIAIFTKFDAQDDKAFAELRNTDPPMDLEAARTQAPSHAVTMFDRDLKDVLYGMKYPPKAHVFLRGMNHPSATCKELVECTAGAIDNGVLKLLFISTQRSTLALCMQTAVDEMNIDSLVSASIEANVRSVCLAMCKVFPHCVSI